MSHPIFVNTALQRLREGRLALGLGVSQLRTGSVALLAKAAGYDWLAIDAEHGTLSLPEIAQICWTALPCGVAPIVRVNANALDEATRLLDNGAQGILVPRVDTLGDARRVVDALCYPPMGQRNWGTVAAQFAYSPPSNITEAQLALQRETLVIAMIETTEAVSNIDAIAQLDGIDALFIGAVDLSLDMGHPSDFQRDAFRNAVERVIAASRRAGKHVGMGGIYHEVTMRQYIAQGVQLLAGGSDQAFMLKAATERAQQLRSYEPPDQAT